MIEIINDLTWQDFKNVVDNKTMSIQCVQAKGHYWIKAFDSHFSVGTAVKIDSPANSDQEDFEANYLPLCNADIKNNVKTEFEREDIVLKLACISGQADGNGDLALQLKVPGTYGTDYRYAAGGYAQVDSYTWGDRLTKVEVIDVDNVTGLGAGAVLKTYHDSEVPEANQGWYFWQAMGTQGEVEIEPMGWYGLLPAGLYLRCTFKVAASKNVQAQIWWGKTE